MRIISFVRVTSALALGSLFFAPGLASGIETQVHHGSDCVQEQGGTYKVDHYGTYNQHTSSTEYLRCPTAGSYYGNSTRSSVWVYDRNSSTDVCCTRYSQDFAGSTHNSQTLCSAGNLPGVQRLTFSASTQWAMVHILCSLPPATASGASYITSYFTAE